MARKEVDDNGGGRGGRGGGGSPAPLPSPVNPNPAITGTEELEQLLAAEIGRPIPLAFGRHLVGGKRFFEHEIQTGADKGKTLLFNALGVGQWSGPEALFVNGKLVDHTDTSKFHFHPGKAGQAGGETDPATPNQKTCSFWPSSFSVQPNFPGIAYLAMKLEPDFEAPSPGFQVIGIYKTLLVRIFDNAGNQTSYAYSSNSAWISLDNHIRSWIAPSKTNGETLSTAEKDEIDFQAFKDWADDCDFVTPQSTKRWESHYALTEETALMRALELDHLLGRAYTLERKAKIAPFMDKARSPVVTVMAADIAEGSFNLGRRSLRDAANRIEVKYRDLDSGKGAGTLSTTGVNVTGSSTKFTERYKPGEPSELDDGAQAGEVRAVKSVVSNTSMVLKTAYSADQSGRAHRNPAQDFQAKTFIKEDTTLQGQIGRVITAKFDLGNSTPERAERIATFLLDRTTKLIRQTGYRLLLGQAGALDHLAGDVLTSPDDVSFDPANTRDFEALELTVQPDGSVEVAGQEYQDIFSDAAAAAPAQVMGLPPQPVPRFITDFINLDFEQGSGDPLAPDSGWRNFQTDADAKTYESAAPLEGSRSLKISGNSGVASNLVNVFRLPVRAGEWFAIEFTGKVSATGVISRAVLRWLDKDDAFVSQTNVEVAVTSKQRVINVDQAPTNAVVLELVVAYASTSTADGDAFFDKIRIRRLFPSTIFSMEASFVPDQLNGATNTGEIDFDPAEDGGNYLIFHPDGSVVAVSNEDRSLMSQGTLDTYTGRVFVCFAKDPVGPTTSRLTGLFQKSHIFVVRLKGGELEYDDNVGWTSYTPLDTDIVIFDVVRGGGNWANDTLRWVGKSITAHLADNSASFMLQGSTPPIIPTGFKYTENITNIHWFWDGTNGSVIIVIYFPDGTNKGGISGDRNTTGLVASTSYGFLPKYDIASGTIKWVNGGSGSTGEAFTVAQQTLAKFSEQFLDGSIPASSGWMIGTTTGGGGGGGGGGGCPMEGTEIVPLGQIAISTAEDNEEWVEIQLRGGRTLCATPNHPVYTNRGKTCLCDIEVGEEVITVKGLVPVATKQTLHFKAKKLVIQMKTGHILWENGVMSSNVKPEV